ncbi:MAG TPA: dienelactone hydrolase family protein [Terriglobales bacterium]|jgi:carboxymethylenebutenolidase
MLTYSVTDSQLTFDSGGKTIQLDCFAPDANGGRFPAVIGLHGSGGGYPVLYGPARLFAAHGFAVYVLHYFDRTGTTRAEDRATAVLHGPAWGRTVWDAIGFVGKEPRVDPEKIALLGISLGAYLSLAVASVDPRVKAVVDYFGGFPKEMKLFMRRFCPVLVLHGENDETVPVSEAHNIREIAEKRNTPCEMKIYPGLGHGLDPETMRDAGERALEFLKRYLGPQASGTG